MNWLKQQTLKWTLADYSVALMLLLFAVYNKFLPILMILAGLSLIQKSSRKLSLNTLLNIRLPLFWFALFFLAHLIGLWNTENLSFAYDDIGMKMSFILFPLYFSVAKLNIKFRQLIWVFVIGLVISWIVFYGYAIFRSIYYPEDNHWGYFKESYLSFTMHRSYYATYNAVGALFSIILFFRTKTVAYILLSGMCIATTILTFSKAGVLILILLFIPLMYYLLTRYLKRVYAFIGIGVIAISLFAAIGLSKGLQERFQKMIAQVSSVETKGNPSVESNASRMIMWSTSFELFTENLVAGVGTGDVQDQLNARNYQLGNTGVADGDYNSHNQYFSSAVQLGLLGLIPLLGVFISTLVLAFRNRSLILLLMTLAFGATLCFESFLETQAGIIPVTLFICIFSMKTMEVNNLRNSKISI